MLSASEMVFFSVRIRSVPSVLLMITPAVLLWLSLTSLKRSNSLVTPVTVTMERFVSSAISAISV